MSFGGNGGGTNSISASSDVALSNPSNGQFLTYNGSLSKWSNAAGVNTVAGRTGTVVLTAADVGLSNVNNTADTDKPLSTAAQTALAAKLSTIETVSTISASGSAKTLPDTSVATIVALTLTADCTITMPTPAAGKSFTLVVYQDSTGGHNLLWPNNVKWPGGNVPVLTGTANSIDYLTFMCPVSSWHGFSSGSNLS